MLYRYSFPVPRHGELVSVTRYVESEHTPTRDELLATFRREIKDARERAFQAQGNDLAWLEVKNIEGIIFALEHIKAIDMPRLPFNGLLETAVICDTNLNRSAIRVSLIKPLTLQPQLRLAMEG